MWTEGLPELIEGKAVRNAIATNLLRPCGCGSPMRLYRFDNGNTGFLCQSPRCTSFHWIEPLIIKAIGDRRELPRGWWEDPKTHD